MTISCQEDREKIKNALNAISASLTTIEAEKDLIKDIVKEIVDEYDLPKRTVNKMAKVYHKQNFSEEVATNDEFETLYEEVVISLTK